jgi:succinate dehydrogenase/fumarate reductase flavoprotein subunit
VVPGAHETPAGGDHGGPDVVVVGSGAAGLAAALAAATEGARVRVLEKAATIGGTTAVSGGVIWAPADHQDRDAACTYLASLAPHADPTLLRAFVDESLEVLAALEAHAGLRLRPLAGYPDYHLDRPGALAGGGRARCSGLFAFAGLGDAADRIAAHDPLPLALAETPLGGGAGVDPETLAGRLASDTRGFGQALLGHLVAALVARGVGIATGCAVTGLVWQHGRVSGVELADGSTVAAPGGVILATGGFEWNPAMAAAFLRGPMTAPASPPLATGDGLALAMRAGAALGHMTEAWWCPVIVNGRWPDGRARAAPVLIERTMPGTLVNRQGRRFVNEAISYDRMAGAFHARDPAIHDYPNLPCWLILDEAARRRMPVAGADPAAPPPDFMVSAESPGKLAEALGIDPVALEATVARFNAHARAGADPDFGRGASPYDRFYGDRSRDGALATLAPLETPPFHAVRLESGLLGTCGGARTDASARVLGQDGDAIPGLYAAGNVMASPTGGIYAGAGGTLGPALTFGWIAGRHAARRGN